MIDNFFSLNENDNIVFDENTKKSEKWVRYYIYTNINGIKSIYVGITSQISYIRLAKNKYIINPCISARFTRHKQELKENKHSNYFLQDMYNKGLEFSFIIDTTKIYKTKQEAKKTENTLIANQSLDSYLFNITGLTINQLNYKKQFYSQYVIPQIEKVLNQKTFSFFLKKILDF